MPEAKEGSRPVAVIVRAHTTSEKTLDLLRALGAGSSYDLYVLANETYGALDYGGVAKIPHTRDTFKAFGAAAEADYFSIHCSDLLLEHVRRQVPDHRHYLMLEYDVHLARGDASFIEALADRLTSPEYEDVDLAAPALRRSSPEWMWYETAAATYSPVWGLFFPIVVLSNRAVAFLHEQRLVEAGRLSDAGPSVTDRVFCEAFVPSALKAAGGFRAVDLKDLDPNCYRWDSFNPGPPRLLEPGLGRDLDVELVHPVLEGAAFLDKTLFYARHSNSLAEFLADLRRTRWPLPSALLSEYEGLAMELIAQGGDPAGAG